MDDACEYAKQRWDKGHKVPYSKVGDLVLVSNLNVQNIKGPKNLKDSYVGPFVIVSFYETNVFQVELSGEMENKCPTIPVSLIKPYQQSDKESVSLTLPPVTMKRNLSPPVGVAGPT
ncbi:hypothetical protein O181_028286 [Austropuccinia psidii MF-1]|uniref:Uncharacterized protein n=1 Tax=Austropuccinia psidii MF-1 TaxID=1389203 RepID=A0A9Q3CU70_9BASI|nr:hypothetical protein [Austropuccinia psidii MF-1]